MTPKSIESSLQDLSIELLRSKIGQPLHLSQNVVGSWLGTLVRIWGASMGFLRVFCGALTTRLCGFCGVSLTWRVLLLFSVDVKCLFRYDRDMADQEVGR